jgi:hypothetical protein
VDAGTGSGKWVLEVADQFPTARVYGLDLSPIQGTNHPLNAFFRVEDLTQGLDFDDGSTDLVHSRLFLLSIPLLMQVGECRDYSGAVASVHE